MIIKCTSKKAGIKVEVDYNLGETLKAAVELHGQEAVLACYIVGAKLRVQGVMRGVIDAGGKPEDAVKAAKSVKLGEIRRRAASSIATLSKKLEKAPLSERAAVLAKLTGKTVEEAEKMLAPA